MAQLKSAAKVDLIKDDINEIYTVPEQVQQVKLAEIILANKDDAETNVVTVQIYKADLNQYVTIIPSATLVALESKFIALSTFLTEGDKIIIKPTLEHLDVMLSYIEG